MRLCHTLIFLLIILLIIPDTHAAVIKGTVYDLDFEPVDNARIEINTLPNQRAIARNGAYEFAVPPGEYVINAVSYKNGIPSLETNETVNVSGDGKFTIDLLLFPILEEEEFEDFEIIEDQEIQEAETLSSYLWAYLAIAIALILLLALLFLRRKKIAETDELKGILDFLKKEGGRATQKNIRSAFPYSEAKISLMVTELEQKGYITKIKRGRSNVVILK